MSRSNSSSTSTGIGIGTVLACILSWSTWHSVLWVIINGLFGWLYVGWWLIFYWK